MGASVLFRFVTEADIPQIVQLFSRAFPGRSMSAAYYRWQFLENPVAPYSAVVAERHGQIVAHVGYSGRRALLNHRPAIAFVKPTSVSDPAVRGSGVYSRLVSWAHESLSRRGGELVLSYPNAHSHAIHITRNDYVDIAQIPALIRTPRASATVCGEKLSFVSASCFHFDTSVESLARSTMESQGFGILRTADYLSWRYGGRPDTEYFACQHYRGGQLVSLLIWKYFPQDNPDRIMVVEWLSSTREEYGVPVLEAIESLADSKGLPVLTWQNVYQRTRHRLLERRGYILGTPVTYFGTFCLSCDERIGPFTDYRQWYIAMGDVDIF